VVQELKHVNIPLGTYFRKKFFVKDVYTLVQYKLTAESSVESAVGSIF